MPEYEQKPRKQSPNVSATAQAQSRQAPPRQQPVGTHSPGIGLAELLRQLEETRRRAGEKDSVSAAAIVKAPGLGGPAPGPRSPAQATDVGDQWIDHGARCDGQDPATMPD